MDGKVAVFTTLLVSLTLAAACIPCPIDTSPPTAIFIGATPTAVGAGVPSREYWDGGGFAGCPVFSFKKGISREAYEALGKCGYYEDTVIWGLITPSLPKISGETSKKVIQALSGSEELWSVSISVTMLANDVYLVACSGKRQQE